jgi:tRNA A37 threonylcarbamoyltransferase TsaD
MSLLLSILLTLLVGAWAVVYTMWFIRRYDISYSALMTKVMEQAKTGESSVLLHIICQSASIIVFFMLLSYTLMSLVGIDFRW